MISTTPRDALLGFMSCSKLLIMLVVLNCELLLIFVFSFILLCFKLGDASKALCNAILAWCILCNVLNLVINDFTISN